MSDRSINGQTLDVLVAGCYELKDTETYVCLEYCNKTYRTRTCKGGRNPAYQDQFSLLLIEGVREINVTVWAKNTFTEDEIIAVGRVHLEKVLHYGSDDSLWPLQFHSRKGGHIRHGGQIKLIMTYRGHQTVTHTALPPVASYPAPPSPTAHQTYQVAFTPQPPQTCHVPYPSLPPPQPPPYQAPYAPPPPPCVTFSHSSSLPPPSPGPSYMYPHQQHYPSAYPHQQRYPSAYPDHPPCRCPHCSGQYRY